MKGARYQPKPGVSHARLGSLVIGPEGHTAEDDQQAARLDAHPLVVKAKPSKEAEE